MALVMEKTCLKLLIIFFLVVGSLAKTRKVKDLSTNMEKVIMGRSSNKVILKSFDGDFFEVNENFVSESQIIQNMIAHNQSNEGVLLQNITGKTLAKVIEYYEKHFARTADHCDEDFETWESGFVKVDHRTLFDLILATNELQLKQLNSLTAATVGKMITGKTPEEICKMFNITSRAEGGGDIC